MGPLEPDPHARLAPALLWPQLPRPACHVTLVVGPPASGKSTWCRRQVPAFDTIVDLDVIIAECTGRALYETASTADVELGLRERNRRLSALAGLPSKHRAAVIVGAPGRQFAWWRQTLRPARVQVMRASMGESLARLRADPLRQAQLDRHVAALRSWWRAEQAFILARVHRAEARELSGHGGEWFD